MKKYQVTQVIFAIVFLAGWIFSSNIVLAQTQSGTQSQISTPNMEKTLGTSEEVLPPAPAPTPPASGDTKKSLPKIEKQDILITGEDKSKIKHEEEMVAIEKQPASVNVPVVGVLKTEASEMLPVPKVIENQVIKPSQVSSTVTQTPFYSFSVRFGSKESLAYDFSHSKEAQTKKAQRFSYNFGVQREKSDGFHYGTITSPFGYFSTDGLNGEGVIYFKDYSVRTGISYFSHIVTLPYEGNQENKLEKNSLAEYIIKIPGGSALKLGINFNKCTLTGSTTSVVDANNTGIYLKFTTPFNSDSPPLAIGTVISQEKVTDNNGTSNYTYTNGYYSLYAESKQLKLSKVNLDGKVAVDGYKNRGTTTTQVDYLIMASYPWKTNTIFRGNIERRLFLPGFSESYIHEDYMRVNSGLIPQLSTKILVGGDWSVSQDVSLSGSFFSENISDFLSWKKATGTDTLYEPANIGDVKLYGIELRLRHNLTKRLVQSISLVGTKHKHQSSGKVVPYIPNARLRIGLGYTDNKGLSASLDGEYMGKRDASDDNNNKLQGYFLVSLTADKQVNDTLSCIFNWENLLGEEYEVREGYYGSPTIAKVGLKLKF